VPPGNWVRGMAERARPQILCTVDISGAPEAREALEAVGALRCMAAERTNVLAAISDVDAYLASASVLIDEEFLDHAPRLRVIGSPSTGTDHMDLAQIDARGITRFDIANERALIEGFSATSELAFGLLLALNRCIVAAQEHAKRGLWSREHFSGFQLLGKTLGIVGLGRLGRISARIGLGFGMNVIAYDPAPVAMDGVEFVPFEAVVKRADVLTIHVHLTRETEGLIGAAEFAQMKHNAILLNTSRGKIVDEAALLSALRSGRIAGAGLDVIDGEWLAQSELHAHPLIAYSRENDNLLIVPHIGGSTRESIYGARVFMARKLASYLVGC
jgi:D-3-phosphoglycerate dehydrogenase / 2-oxoglutarate reductase